MKKIFFLCLIILSTAAYSQKYAFVDTEYILNRIPAYKAAQDELDKLSKAWQKEIEALYEEIEKMYKEYQSEKVLLTEEMRRKREEEIISKEKTAKELQKKYFGPEGALFQKRKELIKPIQDEIYNAIKDIANENGYALILDTSAGPTVLYFNPRYDISDDVLQRLGYKK